MLTCREPASRFAVLFTIAWEWAYMRVYAWLPVILQEGMAGQYSTFLTYRRAKR